VRRFRRRPRDGRGRGIEGFFGGRDMSRNMARCVWRLKVGRGFARPYLICEQMTQNDAALNKKGHRGAVPQRSAV